MYDQDLKAKKNEHSRESTNADRLHMGLGTQVNHRPAVTFSSNHNDLNIGQQSK